ncbi:MAG: acyl-CoA thioesterase [Pseudomonadota bacterium]
MRTHFSVVISERDLDELGHVNNARYFDHLESARMDWYAKTELFETVAEAEGNSDLGTVVVNINIDFRRECLLGETIQIDTAGERVGRKSLALRQVMLKPDGEVAADAVVTSVVMDLQSRAGVVLPTSVHQFFES